MGNSHSLLHTENINATNGLIVRMNELLQLMKNSKLSIDDLENLKKQFKLISRATENISRNFPLQYYIGVEEHKFVKKSQNVWIYSPTCETDDDSLYHLSNIVNHLANDDDIKKSEFYSDFKHGDIIELPCDSPSYRCRKTLFVIKDKNHRIKLQFSHRIYDNDFKTSDESLPPEILNQSPQFPITRYKPSNCYLPGSYANLSVKFLMELILSNPEFFIDSDDIKLSDGDNEDFTLLKCDWGIFCFNKNKKWLFDYIKNPNHSKYVLGFGDECEWAIPEVWLTYIEKTGKPYVVCKAWVDDENH